MRSNARARGSETPRIRYFLVDVPAVMALGLGMTLHNARAILRGLFGRSRVFERTPKVRKEEGGSSRPRPFRGGDPLVWLEGGMGVYVLSFAILSLWGGSALSTPFLGLFVCGYFFVFFNSRRER